MTASVVGLLIELTATASTRYSTSHLSLATATTFSASLNWNEWFWRQIEQISSNFWQISEIKNRQLTKTPKRGLMKHFRCSIGVSRHCLDHYCSKKCFVWIELEIVTVYNSGGASYRFGLIAVTVAVFRLAVEPLDCIFRKTFPHNFRWRSHLESVSEHKNFFPV